MENIGIVLLLVTIVLVIWLAVISYFLYRTINHYNTLIKLTNRKTLSTILEQLVSQARANHTTIQDVEKRLTDLEKNTEFHLQKVGLLRYNPFADTGGEQSFVVSLLDKNNSGMILTSLQGRSGTRWYAKQVKDGKGVEFSLSKEEEEAVKKAKKLT